MHKASRAGRGRPAEGRKVRGGLVKIQQLTGLSAPTIIKGIKEIKSGKPLSSQERVREIGGGRKTVEPVNRWI